LTFGMKTKRIYSRKISVSTQAFPSLSKLGLSRIAHLVSLMLHGGALSLEKRLCMEWESLRLLKHIQWAIHVSLSG
jgi:hypothetical protein